jgi:hypothetical protein
MQVEIAVQFGRQLADADAAGGGVQDEGRGHATGQRVEQILHWIRALVRPQQHRRFAVGELEWLGARVVFPAGAVEVLNRRAVFPAVDPGIAGAELEPGQRRRLFNGGEGLHHLVLVEAVDQGFLGWGRHGGGLSLMKWGYLGSSARCACLILRENKSRARSD